MYWGEVRATPCASLSPSPEQLCALEASRPFTVPPPRWWYPHCAQLILPQLVHAPIYTSPLILTNEFPPLLPIKSSSVPSLSPIYPH